MIAPHLQDKYVNLYADCMPVAGACKSALYDNAPELSDFRVSICISCNRHNSTPSAVCCQRCQMKRRKNPLRHFCIS
jgi:hypothetical protein